jgi:predicted metal-dependent peptidase
MFYTATVKVMFEDDKGRQKSRRETYLVNAESVTDVEVIVTEDFAGSMQDFQIVRVAKSGIVDILNWGDKKSKAVKKTSDEFSEM